MNKIVPVIMSGGAGTRLWPASRKAAPKQLLPLISDHTMIQDTAQRLTGSYPDLAFAPPLIICGKDHGRIIKDQLAAIGLANAQVMSEPMARNTAPCAAAAAIHIAAQDEDALMLLAPADHHIKDEAAFRVAIARAAPMAQAGNIVTFGITASRPETGYGYIERGEALDDYAYRVAAFHEKPDAERAATYVASGRYFWNGGIFLARPSTLLAEMQTYCPDIVSACQRAVETAGETAGIINLNADAFAASPSDSIDYAVMEKTGKAAVVEADIGWSDIGSWAALHEMKAGERGNALSGDVHVIDTQNCLVQTDGMFVAAIGVEDLAIVVHEGAVLVSKLDSVQDVKEVVAMLKDRGRTDLL